MQIRPATVDDIDALAMLAARTFPLAAPPHVTPESLATFIDQHLSAARFSEYLRSPHHAVTVADEGTLTGYTLLVFGDPADADVRNAVSARPAVEISKVYVDPDAHGSGTARSLIIAAFEEAERRGAAVAWLGVNQENVRAQRFYEKSGFERVGTKRFQVGAGLEHDFIYVRPLRGAVQPT